VARGEEFENAVEDGNEVGDEIVCSNTDTGLTPMSPLGVISVRMLVCCRGLFM
jgi:hypothetical protein